MPSSESTGMARMVPWLHFSGGDNLWFHAWHPTSHSQLAGACIVLIVLAILERGVARGRGVVSTHLRAKALRTISPADINANPATSEKFADALPTVEAVSPNKKHATIPPFVLTYELIRGGLCALQAMFGYALMLGVMTQQAAYIISIIVGLGLGEFLFGRVGVAAGHMH
ncbi:hypothetical protein JAAARDRAFT_143303 [Jaapia argillacea MUCL 33604]|uniref:Copper transport protein n=1 Tax=Jaapia argillacea MUCL 33604 TaxID=933084 RepID=A0A067PGF2_9AGAM|nr:hypothetical protein JAAARDRAFT_143303 [Jaapia argillacea MUCL 33604]